MEIPRPAELTRSARRGPANRWPSSRRLPISPNALTMSILCPDISLPALRQAHRRPEPFGVMLSLQHTATGWALVDDRRQLVFAADGPDARRLSLARASALGVVCLRFDEECRIA